LTHARTGTGPLSRADGKSPGLSGLDVGGLIHNKRKEGNGFSTRKEPGGAKKKGLCGGGDQDSHLRKAGAGVRERKKRLRRGKRNG